MICSTTSLKDLCIFLLGLNLLLLENGCPNVFDHSSHEKCQAEPDNQELFTPRQPKHPINICHRTALSSHQPKPVPCKYFVAIKIGRRQCSVRIMRVFPTGWKPMLLCGTLAPG